MLIKSIDAKNFRKYETLTINDLPETGVITIAGSNESGKTSIGEAICFALFGRTFFLDEKNLKKVIRWGTEISEVSLIFKTGDGDIFSLWRSVDRNGEIKVKLSKTNSDVDIIGFDTPLEDPEKVRQALSRVLGFDYDAFSNSYYLAQRELTSPDPHSYSIKQMAGISAYSEITDSLDLSNQKQAETIEELTPQAEETQAKLDEIDLDETWLPELIEAEETLGAEQQGRQSLVGRLKEDDESYTSNFTSFHGAKKSAGFFAFLSKFAFLATAILWALWILNTYFPEILIEFLANNFGDSTLTSFSTFAEQTLLPAAIITLVITVFSWLMRKNAKAKMQSLNTEAAGLSSILSEGHAYVTSLAESLMPERVVQLLHERDSEPSTLQILPPREKFNNLTSLITDASDYKADPEEMLAATTSLSETLTTQDKEISGLSANILGDISEEKIRSDKAGNLRVTLQNLFKVIDKCNYTIETQDIAIGIMQRSATNSIDKFNQNISDVSATTLPNFTQDRYSKIKIADDFSVQIYSDEKNDYMDFDEISSGTQRQVMLALRIAMSEQLSLNTGNEEQFIFLDEPFAFFDQSRTNATLSSLPDVSDVINQIWISAQEFPDDVEVAMKIECPSDQSVLIM